MNDNQRIQVDVRGLPEGVKPELIAMAKAADVSLTDFIRTILCRVARPQLPSERLAELMAVVDAPTYVPLT